MRILHLIDSASPQASATTLALLQESLGRLGHIEQRLLLMGGSSLQASARSVGIADATLVGLPCRQILLGWPGIRRQVAAMAAPGAAGSPRTPGIPGIPGNPGNPGKFDLIHCWSVATFVLASLAWRKTPRVLTLTTPPSAPALRWLSLLMREPTGRSAILPISATLRRHALAAGVPETTTHVLRPGLSLGMVDAAARTALRKRWGVADHVKVAMLLSDPPADSDTVAGMMATGLAEESSRGRQDAPEFRLIVHPDQRGRRRAQTICRHVGRSNRVIQEPLADQPWAVLPGCDLALALDTGAGFAGGSGLSLLWAMAANVPIVGEATYAISEIVEDHHSALLTRPGQPKSMAHRITQLADDKLLAYKLRDTARHEAYSFFSRQRYCDSLRAVYSQMAENQPIQVPELPVTGGLRFTGRA